MARRSLERSGKGIDGIGGIVKQRRGNAMSSEGNAR